MKKLIFIIFLSVLVFFTACDDDGILESMPSGAYSYKSYDSTGTSIIQGWISITYEDSSNVIGQWHFEKTDNSQYTGPQVGNGKLEGAFDDERTAISLHPQFRDHGILLSGSIKNNVYRGIWQQIGYPGITNHGTFEAIKD